MKPTIIAGGTLTGTAIGDVLHGGAGSDRFFSGGVSQGNESVRSNGGADYLVFTSSDALVADGAGNGIGDVRIRDFVIDNTAINFEADSIVLGDFFGQQLNAANIGGYLHIVSDALAAPNLSVIYLNREGDFSAADKQALDDGEGFAVGYGADLFLEYQAQQGDNHFENITGHADNSFEQLQALIDMGFLTLSPTDIFGSTGNDFLVGTSANENFISRGGFNGGDDVRGNGGSDTLIFSNRDPLNKDVANAMGAGSHYRIRDWMIEDKQQFPDADSIAIGDLIGRPHLNASNIGPYIHIISGTFGANRSSILIDVDGQFTDEDRLALNADPASGGYGTDLFLEF